MKPMNSTDMKNASGGNGSQPRGRTAAGFPNHPLPGGCSQDNYLNMTISKRKIVAGKAHAAGPQPPARRAPRMARNVPIDLLRSFVTIVDAGSMAQATETIFLTPSALSLQMKRLEDLLGQRVFRRQGRSLT